MQSQDADRRPTLARYTRPRIVTPSADPLGKQDVEPTVIELMEELLQSIEQRDAGDPDAPAWEAARRIHQLEEELVRRLRGGALQAADAAAVRAQVHLPDEVLAGIA
jgi:hypothetical protein